MSPARPSAVPGMQRGQNARPDRWRVSAIVPVFNEEKTVAAVVRVLLQSPCISEVICVDDGSTDRSQDVLRRFDDRITVVHWRENRGKGAALAEGVRKAHGDIVVFFDADLTTLSGAHIRALLAPLGKHGVRAVLGYPAFGPYRPNFFPHLTGERAYHRQDLLSHLKQVEHARLGVEIVLNQLFPKAETRMVPLPGLRGLYKHNKRAPGKAVREYLSETGDILREMTRREGALAAHRQAVAAFIGAVGVRQWTKWIGGSSRSPVPSRGGER